MGSPAFAVMSPPLGALAGAYSAAGGLPGRLATHLTAGVTLVGLSPTPAPPGTTEARDALFAELRDPAYVRSWWGLFVQWLQGVIAIPVGDRDLAPLLAPVLVAIGIGLIGLVAWLMLRSRRHPPEAPTTVFAADEILDAAEHRRRARVHLQAGHAEAGVVEAFRALTAAGLARGEIRDSLDLTAHEAGRALVGRHPRYAVEVRRADRTFAGVRYGDATASTEEAERILDLDVALEAAESQGDEGRARQAVPAGAFSPPTPPTAYAGTESSPAGRPPAPVPPPTSRRDGHPW